MAARRDSRSTDELIAIYAEEFLRRARLGGANSEVWEGRARDLLEGQGGWPARAERDMKDGAFMMEFAAPFQRFRREERLVTDAWPPAG
jgi:hypothetical protein